MICWFLNLMFYSTGFRTYPRPCPRWMLQLPGHWKGFATMRYKKVMVVSGINKTFLLFNNLVISGLQHIFILIEIWIFFRNIPLVSRIKRVLNTIHYYWRWSIIHSSHGHSEWKITLEEKLAASALLDTDTMEQLTHFMHPENRVFNSCIWDWIIIIIILNRVMLQIR